MHDPTSQNKQLAAWLEVPRGALIDGRWRPAQPGSLIDIIDPASGLIMGRVAAAGAAEIDEAVSAARRTFEDGAWRKLGGDARSRILWRISELLLANSEILAELETRENGMLLAAARNMVAFSAEGFRHYAGFCRHVNGQTATLSRNGLEGFAYSVEEPVGVAGLITAWNGPLIMATWKMAPALAAGCSCVVKPPEDAPLTTLMLGELMIEAGVPAGVVNIVPGFGAEAGAALASHPGVDKISFTGSTITGKTILSASVGNLKRVTLELGGKSPFIIFDDADIEAAISSSTMSICGNAGQICVAGSRLLVQQTCYDRVVEGIARQAGALKVGSGLDPSIQMGPLISARQLDRIATFVEGGRDAGAELVAGGHRLGGAGFFFEPTVFANVRQDMKIVSDEIFGPVLVVIPFETEEEAIAIANNTLYGLAAYVWTSNHSRAIRVSDRIRAGMIMVNTISYRGYEFGAGGFKQSGLGRENGPNGLEPFLETKWVITQTNQ